MNLGVSMWSYFRVWRAGNMSIPDFVREANRAGADGVELLDFFYQAAQGRTKALTSPEVDSERSAIKAALAETGLTVPIFSIAQNHAKTDPEERANQVEKIRFGVDEARNYGAKVVRVFAGDVAEGITFDQARGWIIEGLAEGARYAHEHGIRLALENHGTLAGRSDQVIGIIQDVRELSGCDALGANPDTGNFQLVDQASHLAVKEVAPYAYMVHFKDFRPAPPDDPEAHFTSLSGKRFAGAAIGEGGVDLGECIEALKVAGFDGWLSVEYEGEEDSMTAVPRSLVNARKFL
ncbi:MAG TPA: sugar phosphate isomerase/epimerase family protein [Fimbriimonadaceae bacterium]|nr:sugar phosphate isomerase/epimerase family protein [Fimbriimonadaceae bacterium]